MADPKQDEEKAGSDGEKAPAVVLHSDDRGIVIDSISSRKSAANTAVRPKAYILHRTKGRGRSYPIPEGESSSDGDEERKPPCVVCYVPPPVYYLAGCLEQNRFCEGFGRIGCFGHDNYEVRQRILLFGLVANTLSLLLSLVACFSLSLNFDHIVAGAFTKGLTYIPQEDVPVSGIWIGLRGVAIRNFQGLSRIEEDFVKGDQVIPFDSFCDYVDEGLEINMDADDCNSCAEASAGLMAALVMATLLTLPNIFTDILRMYPNYDLNCQKFFGSVLNLASACSSLYTWRGYADLCFLTFYDHDDAESTDSGVSFLWVRGSGMICIVLATLLKAFDIIAMLLIPTPDIAHTKSFQEEYEALYGEKEETASPLQDPKEERLDEKPETTTKITESPEVGTC